MTTKLSKVLVFGATGAQGSPVVRHLLSRGVEVRGITRHPEKLHRLFGGQVEACNTDLGDPAGLVRAFRGVDAAFFHLPVPSDPAAVPTHLANVLDAAIQGNLARLVFTTSGMTTEQMPPIGLVEGNRAAARAVLASGVPSVVLRPTIYLENLLWPHLVVEMSRGTLSYPPVAGGRRLSWTGLEDQAALAIAAMSAEGAVGQAFDIASPESLTGDELAHRLSAHFGREIRFTPQTPEQLGKGLGEAFGNPAVGQAIAELYEATAKLPPDGAVIDLAPALAVLNVELTPVSRWLAGQRWVESLVR